MFDLNLALVSNYLSDSVLEKLPDAPAGVLETSGSLDSSVVNAADDDSSSVGDAVAYRFSILKQDDAVEEEGAAAAADKTIQLFPVVGSSPTIPIPQRQCLDVSSRGYCRGFPDPEQRLVARKQQVKKSRRGPRSRSSQYRGVTFYRRTGRWESHIWLAFLNLFLHRYWRLLVFIRDDLLYLRFCVDLYRDCGKQVYLGNITVFLK